jgi:hypothetical protein
MTVKLNGSSDNNNLNLSESYTVVSSSSSEISVDLTYNGAESGSYSAGIFTNGTVAWFEFGGQNESGSTSGSMAIGIFAGFIFEIDYVDSLNNFTQILQFHSTGSSTVTIGSVSIPVTTYAANSLPVTTSTCGGSDTLTAFSLTAGTPSGAKLPLVTSATLAGTGTNNGESTSYSISVQVTGLTLA